MGINRPRASISSCYRCLSLYYLVWLVVVAVAMAVYFIKSPHYHLPSPLIIIFPVATFVAPFFLVICILCPRWYDDPAQPTSAERQLINPTPPSPPCISNLHIQIAPSLNPSQGISFGVHPWRVYNHDDLDAATQNFDEANILGSGGEATVFKGIEVSEDKTHARHIAVKRFYHATSDPTELERANVQFKREVQVLTRASHPNVVKLYGYCIHGRGRLLVYELMPNGSLYDWLFAPKHDPRRDALTWDRRLTIAQDAARGLDYLHNHSNVNLIHLDMKPQNILLDENLNAKVADFGLSKLIHRDQTRVPGTKVGGTPGYLPPELNMLVKGWENNITKKADVYSFGIVLLQLVSGRTVNDAATMPPNAAENLLPGLTFRDAAFFLVRTQQTHKLVDTSLAAAANSSVAMKMAEIGAKCIEINPMDRPDMNRVSDMLEGIG